MLENIDFDDYPFNYAFYRWLERNGKNLPKCYEGKIKAVNCPRDGIVSISSCLNCPYFIKKTQRTIYCKPYEISGSYKCRIFDYYCYSCSECGYLTFWFDEMIKHVISHHARNEFWNWKEQVEKNLKIIIDLLFRKDKKSRIRKNMAIYRLYRWLEFTPKEIAEITTISETGIQLMIGSAFKELCLRDKTCIFKKFFSEQPKKK